MMKRLGGILVVGFGLGALLAVALHGQANYNPQPINFGSVKLGQASPVMSSTLTNTGTDTLKFPGGSSMQPPTAPTSGCSTTGFCWVADNCTARASGASCILQYRFTPKSAGTLTGANVVMTNHGPFPLNFTGIGVDTVTPTVAVARVLLNVAGTVNLTLPGGTWQGLATPVDSAGRTLMRPVTWRASNPAIASVDPTGLVRAISPGTDTIVASSGGKSAFFLALVNTPPAPTTLTCGTMVPPPVGCGMRDPLWALLGITTAGMYGPWYQLDTLGYPHRIVRVMVTDTVP